MRTSILVLPLALLACGPDGEPPDDKRGPQPVPLFECTVTSLDFGEVAVGADKSLDAVVECTGNSLGRTTLGAVDLVDPMGFQVADVSGTDLRSGESLFVPATFAPPTAGPFQTQAYLRLADYDPELDPHDEGLPFTLEGVGVAPAGTPVGFVTLIVEDLTPNGVPGGQGTDGIDLDALYTTRPDGTPRSPIVTELATGSGDCSATFGQSPDLSEDGPGSCSTTGDAGGTTFLSLGGLDGYIEVGFGVPFESGGTIEIVECSLDGNEAYSVVVEDDQGNRYLLVEGVSGPLSLDIPYAEELPAPM